MAHTIKMSSKGQLVIPVDVRRELELGRGSRFELQVQDDEIVLKPIADADWREYRGILEDGPSLTEALEKERQQERERQP